MSREFYVPCAPYAYPIRSGLPNIGHHLRRLMKLKSQRELKNDESTPDVSVAMSSLNNDNLTKIRQGIEDEDNVPNLAHSSEVQDLKNSQSSFTESQAVPPIASTSASLADPQTSDFSIESDLTISGIIEQPSSPTSGPIITRDAEASMDDLSDRMTLGSIVTEDGAIIAGDPFNYAAALNAQLGYDRIRTYAELLARREHEPRSLPLLFFQDETRDFSTISSTSGVNGSITSGSENSSVNGVSEVVDDNTEESLAAGRRPDRRDEAQQYYDASLRASQCSSGSTDGVVVSSEVVGMDCMPLRPGPFHYLISEQAKSLVALQELQNEVGALLEFRDLVIETFPNLRHKMATSSSSAAASAVVSVMSNSQTSSHIPLPLSSPSSRRISEWEPGKVRRRVAQPVREGESSGSSLPRSRSNSHSGGSKNSATVQDSGFSTETSSKDSASTAIPRPASPRPVLDEAEDELWNLLDVIHRKGIRLREEVESLQGRLESVAPEELGISCDVLEAVKSVTRRGETDNENLNDDSVDDPGNERNCRVVVDEAKTQNVEIATIREDGSKLIVLRMEREQLLDKVAELEAETISSRARAQELQTELAALSALRNGLEDRLRSVLETRNEIVTPGAQRKQASLIQTSGGSLLSSPKNCVVVNIRGSKQSAFATIVTSNKSHKNRFRTRTIEKNVLANGAVLQPIDVDVDPEVAAHERRIRLGALDSVLVSPTRVAHVGNVDSVKIAAILREHSPLELQRHLITTTVHNQCLQKRLDEVEKSTETLSERLDKAREENDDLRFQLEERNIELEGTRARVRVLERLQQRPPTEAEPEVESESEPRCEPCCLEPGSSTESARDHNHSSEIKPSPRRRPSRIPLLGSGTKPTAPKPPGTLGKNDSGRDSLTKSLKSLTTSRPPRDSSRDSNAGTPTTKSSSLSRGTARDSSRESLTSRQSITKTSGKEASRESLNRSLSRNNNTNRDSINKTTITTTMSTTTSASSLSRARDSLESTNTCNNNNISLYPPGTPPRRPPAPARRSQSLARPSVDNDSGKGFTTDPPSSWCSSSSSFCHSDSSLYPDSLNQETTSATGSTRVEFILGSPTRHFRPSSAWPSRYFDSINSTAIAAESLITDEFPLRRGEALAECDSLECHPISSEG